MKAVSPIHRRICDGCKQAYYAFGIERATREYRKVLFGFCGVCTQRLRIKILFQAMG